MDETGWEAAFGMEGLCGSAERGMKTKPLAAAAAIAAASSVILVVGALVLEAIVRGGIVVFVRGVEWRLERLRGLC